MPEPKDPSTILPTNFDADRHCGAKSKQSGVACMMEAGWGTDHFGRGRCKLHGGASSGRPIIHGMFSKELRMSFRDKVEVLSNDPELVDLTVELAVGKAALAHEVEAWEESMAAYEGAVAAYLADPETNPLPRRPELNVDMLTTIAKVATSQHKILYDKANTISLRDFQSAMTQVKNIFTEVMREYGIPAAAAQEFARRMDGLRLSGNQGSQGAA